MISSPSLSDFGTHDESRYPELWEGCVGAWAPCLGPTGTRLHDFSRGSNWGTLTNMDAATDWIVSLDKYALDFDSTSDIVTFPTSERLEPRPTGSVSVWGAFRTLLGFSVVAGTNLNSSVNSAFTIGVGAVPNYYFRGYIANGATLNLVASTITPSTSRWYHLCLTWSGSVVSFFIDGNLIGTTAQTINPQVGIGPISIGNVLSFAGTPGSGTNTGAMNGWVDDFIFYDHPLNNAKIRLLASSRGVAYQRRRRRSYFAEQITPAFRASWIKKPSQLIGGGTY